MKIIHCVESYYPNVGGMQEVVKQLSERLVKLGHTVIVCTRFHEQRTYNELNGVNIEVFKIEANPFNAKTEEELRYQTYLLNTDAEVITFFAAQQWATNLALPILNKIKAKKVSVPTGYSGLYWPEFKQYFEDMKTYIHGYDMNVYLSNDYRDINFARENGVTKLMIIPNGAAEDEFLKTESINVRKELGLKDDTFLLLHVGSYTGWKGHDELIEIFRKSNLKNAALIMIGNNYEHFFKAMPKYPKRLLNWLLIKLSPNKKAFFNHYSRAFTVAAYKQANIFIFPSNIECSPIVLFECAAAKLPFLATDVGNSIEIADWTKGGKILPTNKDSNGFSFAKIEESIKSLNSFYENANERKQMAETSHAIWHEKYSWEKITLEYEKLYQQLRHS
jgi:glycosyltransferase involved in cell wall biosynthesis